MGMNGHFQASWASQPMGCLLLFLSVFYCSMPFAVFTQTWLRYVRVFAIANPPVCRLQSVTFVHPTQGVELASRHASAASCYWLQQCVLLMRCNVTWYLCHVRVSHLLMSSCTIVIIRRIKIFIDDDDDEIAYFTVRWKTRASFVYRTKNVR